MGVDLIVRRRAAREKIPVSLCPLLSETNGR
jgi:hypothetical protein